MKRYIASWMTFGKMTPEECRNLYNHVFYPVATIWALSIIAIIISVITWFK